jgi:hypothetical protein
VVLGLPINVVIGIVIPIIGAPIRGECVLIWTRASRVGVVQRYRTSSVCAASDMGNGALVPLVSPGVAETTEFLLVALLGVMADLVAGLAACPGPLILGALGANMATVTAHGAEGVYVDDGGGGQASWRRNGRCGADSGVSVEGRRSGRGGADGGGSVKEGRAYHAFCCGVVCFFADGTGRGGGPSFALALILVVVFASSTSSIRRNGDRWGSRRVRT